MVTPRRRGACPTLAEPMQTGDGLLARMAIRGTVALDALAALCAAAGRHGNGVIEITARGNLQVRGLTENSKDIFAARVAELGLDIAAGLPIAVNPLAGLEPGKATDSADIAADLDRALAASPFVGSLGPKVSVVIDGGSLLHLDALAADVRLTATGADIDDGRAVSGSLPPCGMGTQFERPRRPVGSAPGSPVVAHTRLRPSHPGEVTVPRGCHLAIGGDAASAVPLGSVAMADAVGAITRLLGVMAARGPGARARDVLRTEGLAPFRDAIGDLIVDAPAPAPRPPAEPLGVHELRDGTRALGLVLPFGHAQADLLGTLIGEAMRAGATGLRLAPARALLFIGLASPECAGGLRLAARRLGFVTDAGDPRRHIAACPGAPRCASAALSTRDLAPRLATIAAALLDGSFTLHLSGCPKGCAHPGGAALTVVGHEATAGLRLDGSAQDTASCDVDPRELPSALARLARNVGAAREPDETVAGVLSRVGTPLLASLLGEAARG